ncbi:TIGR04283 family arsenosugar biosynthesis glycosyltransferase [Jiulongibacter sediminis]|uniref:TIGR04283 family arsenosugar biosynthesis glycosyltransferase n=1 Tax=Jiulongibacter sediminis TaxID=1605367 RepID=UPI0026F08D62|nr:TIGR04283 family arsenosugar biosynthesis glycosyltransferase [Jiulongibacter sediminis]
MLSIIIPTYNEAATIRPCLERLRGDNIEVILADSPGSNDSLEVLVKDFGFTYLKCQNAGRNHQMNEGAAIASGEVLYFVHADTLVHSDFKSDIITAIEEGAEMGCYRYKFDRYPNPLMYINSFFTRFPMIWCRGGDQTLFIKKEVFEELNGFCPQHLIMEDYDILLRSKDRYRFKIIQKDVTVSARKYETNSYWRILKANYTVMRKWLKKEASPVELHQLYKNLLNYRNG